MTYKELYDNSVVNVYVCNDGDTLHKLAYILYNSGDDSYVQSLAACNPSVLNWSHLFVGQRIEYLSSRAARQASEYLSSDV